VAKGLHVIIGKALQLAKQSSRGGGAVKYIGKKILESFTCRVKPLGRAFPK
jgi:hypothetical protein